jgi:type I restriction enzyme S subunit
MTSGIPIGWVETTVGKACSIRNDLRFPISKEERADISGSYPYYGPTGELDRLSEYRLEGTFALIGEDGDHFLDVENKPQTLLVSGRFNVNNHAHVIASTDACSAEWFFNYFRHRSLIASLTRQGAGRYKLNKAALEKLPILLPPVVEQEAISSLIHDWDTAIETTERLVSVKQGLHAALTARLYALSNHHGERNRMCEFLKESIIPGASGLHARKITVKLYGKGVIAKGEKRLGSEKTQYYVRHAGQLIYSKLDFLNGAFGLIPEELDGFESTLDLPAFDIDPSVNPAWLLGYLTRPEYYTRKTGLARGQRKARRVHPADLLASSFHVPSRQLQDQIAETLATSNLGIDNTIHLLESLKTQKRGLMQKLLTGQWRVPVIEEAMT